MSSASSWSAPVICPARPWLAAGPAPTAPVPGSGSHRATNLIAGYGLTSAPGPGGVSVLLACAAVVRVVGSAPRAGSVPWYSHGDRQTSCGALPGRRLRCRVPAR
jgi:hypothetical protein